MNLNNLYITTLLKMGSFYSFCFPSRVQEEKMKVLILMFILNCTTFFLVSFQHSSTGNFLLIQKKKHFHINYVPQKYHRVKYRCVYHQDNVCFVVSKIIAMNFDYCVPFYKFIQWEYKKLHKGNIRNISTHKKNVCMDVYNSSIHNCQELVATKRCPPWQ